DSDSARGAGGAIAQQTFEVRLSRFVSDGVHEDVDVTNFTQAPARLTLDLIAGADFADLAETRDMNNRLQYGKIRRRWNADTTEGRLSFRYRARHMYRHQGNDGTAQIDRGVELRFHSTTSAPKRRGEAIRFTFVLEPRATWHLCVDIEPEIDGVVLP